MTATKQVRADALQVGALVFYMGARFRVAEVRASAWSVRINTTAGGWLLLNPAERVQVATDY